jgi:putative nucleotidyltransferase with HDIG domain
VVQETPTIDAGCEAHCRRLAVWSLALEEAANATPANAVEIGELAEALEEHFAWEPFSEPGDETNPLAEVALECLRITTEADLDRSIAGLPVFPSVALRALRMLGGDEWSAAELEKITAMDQTLAAHILSAANSWVHGLQQRVTRLAGAITYIGAERTSRIVYAASIRPLFASGRLREIWHHSLAAAQAAESLAALSGTTDPQEAFLAGLVHDIGRLAMETLPRGFHARFGRLVELGCDELLVERVLSGFSHAEAGARALKFWNFPGIFIEAVEFHHQPEKSKGNLAAILFLTEHWLDSREDAPSLVRFNVALERTGLSADAFEQLGVKADRSMDGLRFA